MLRSVQVADPIRVQSKYTTSVRVGGLVGDWTTFLPTTFRADQRGGVW